jgi:putative heme-binding domain-containing protein
MIRYLPFLWIALALPLSAQHRDMNPFSSPADMEEGKKLYRINCGVCHGMQGNTGRGARLAVRKHRHGNTDAELFRVIQNGVAGTEMPGLYMDEDSIWKILLFVRTLEVDAGEACEPTPGSAQAGRQLFEASCSSCHTVGPLGGRLGPDLTYVGLNYSREQLRDAILEPSKDVAARYQSVELTAQGKKIEGVLLNEDGYSLSLMDRDENMRSYYRTEVENVRKTGASLMPAYGGIFNDKQIDDLSAYMCSLTGKR